MFMNTTQFVLSLLLLALLIGVAWSYYVNAQRMLQLRREMDTLQAQARAARAVAVLRNERTRAHLQLQSLEAHLAVTERLALSADELEMVDLNQKTIRNCVDALKHAGEWLGLPFDLEWVDMLERLPRLNALYRASLDNEAQEIDARSGDTQGMVDSVGYAVAANATPSS